MGEALQMQNMHWLLLILYENGDARRGRNGKCSVTEYERNRVAISRNIDKSNLSRLSRQPPISFNPSSCFLPSLKPLRRQRRHLCHSLPHFCVSHSCEICMRVCILSLYSTRFPTSDLLPFGTLLLSICHPWESLWIVASQKRRGSSTEVWVLHIILAAYDSIRTCMSAPK